MSKCPVVGIYAQCELEEGHGGSHKNSKEEFLSFAVNNLWKPKSEEQKPGEEWDDINVKLI